MFKQFKLNLMILIWNLHILGNCESVYNKFLDIELKSVFQLFFFPPPNFVMQRKRPEHPEDNLAKPGYRTDMKLNIH
jgi:hypothetical protein